jgi:hypothetical protein
LMMAVRWLLLHFTKARRNLIRARKRANKSWNSEKH